MRIISRNFNNKKTLPSINYLINTSNSKTYPIVFFVDIDNTLLVTIETEVMLLNYNNYVSITPIKSLLNFYLIDDSINNDDIDILNIELLDEDQLIYNILLKTKKSLFKLKIKFRHNLYEFFLLLNKITPYVGLFTAGNKEYAGMIYKILYQFYNIRLSFYFSVGDVSPELYQIKYNNDFYNGKDLTKALSILQNKLINKRRPVFTLPVLIDDNPIWCINGWILPIDKLEISSNMNFNSIYDKDIMYSNISIIRD